MDEYGKVIEFINSQNANQEHIKTGYLELDKAIGYNLKGSLITVGARPSMGKTAFLTTLALNLIKNDSNILFFTFEQSKEMLLRRLMLQQAKIPIKRVWQEAFSAEEKQALEAAVEFIAPKLVIDDKFNVDIKFIEAKIKRQHFDYLLIDGVHLLKTSDLDEFLAKLKKITAKYGTTCFVTANLTQELEQRDCRFPLLGDTGIETLEELSEVVIFPYRPNYYEQDFELREENFEKAMFYIAKNKFGPTWSLDMQFNRNLVCFEDIPIIDVF